MKKLILMGKSASGKDTLRAMLEKKGLKKGISHTTRAQRNNETQDVDYHFVTMEKYLDLESKDFFLESETFNKWKYGRSYEAINEGDVFIVTPTGVANMVKKMGRDIFYIVETVCNDDIRKERAIKRGDNINEIERRLKTDEYDFSAERPFTVDEVLNTEDENSYENFVKKHFPS